MELPLEIRQIIGFVVTMGLSILFGWFIIPSAMDRNDPGRLGSFLLLIIFFPFAGLGLFLRLFIDEWFGHRD